MSKHGFASLSLIPKQTPLPKSLAQSPNTNLNIIYSFHNFHPEMSYDSPKMGAPHTTIINRPIFLIGFINRHSIGNIVTDIVILLFGD